MSKQIESNEDIFIVINPQTGEEIDIIRKGDRVLRRESSRKYQEELDKFTPKDTRKFTKMFHNQCRELTRLRLEGKITPTEELLIRTLGDYLDFSGDNIVKIDGKAMGTKTIGEKILGYGKSQTINILKKLIEQNLIAKVKRGRNVIYVLNPLYYHRGKVLKTTMTLFSIETDNIEWDICNDEY